MSWETAYEAQIDTWAFWQTEVGQIYASSFARDVREKKRGQGDTYEHLPETESLKLLRAEPIWVEEEMMDLWEAAAEGFQPEPFEATDLITPAGFLYLPRPMYMHDIYGKRCSWRAVAWAIHGLEQDDGSVKLGVNISLYTHRDDDDDYGPLEYHDGTLGEHMHKYPLTVLHCDTWEFGQSFDDLVDLIDTGEVGGARGLTDDERANAKKGFRETWRHIQAGWRLMQETVSTPVKRDAPRATRRRAKRQLDEIKPVTVIQLRKAKKPREGEARDVDWTHRWPVRGHWRNQWYPSLGIHRQRWIDLFIKGPEDKPLRISEKRAFELKR